MPSDYFDIKNKVVVITGAAGLLGSAFSRACAEYGAIVIIIDINDKGSITAKKLISETKNKNIYFKKCDITNEESVKRVVKTVVNQFGGIDALVNNAYPRNKNFGQKFEDTTYEDFGENLSMNVGGYFLMTKEVARDMIIKKKGNIIFMGSIYGFVAPKFEIYRGTSKTMPIVYPAIKGGIINMMKYLASYLGPYKIRVNAISPGGVPIPGKIFARQNKKFIKQYIQKVRLANKRMANPEDITGVLLFLLSDASRYMTGQNIVVDGGWSI